VITDILAFVRLLGDAGVDYIIVGGVAGNVHGALRTTLDIDIVYSRRPENVDRLVRALAPCQPYLRGAPAGLPFVLDAETIRRGLNFTLTTTIGDIDLLGEVTGGGRYEDLRSRVDEVELEGRRCLVVSLEALIALKRAAGRPRDREALAELEALLEERNRR
jgi:predicted nucleotidyltransferase